MVNKCSQPDVEEGKSDSRGLTTAPSLLVLIFELAPSDERKKAEQERVFRHQHNASMNGEDSGDENSLKGFYAYKNTFDEDAIWMDIPKHGETF